MKIKKNVIYVCVLFISIFLNNLSADTATDTEAWRILERASILFEKGELGESFLFCEKARAMHTAEISNDLSVLRIALAPAEVKHVGEDISAVRSILEKRNDNAALAILDKVLLNHSSAFFEHSILKLLSWLENRMVYPEVDFLVGKIYEAEGENLLARSYYEKAWLNRTFLDVGDEQFTIVYRLSDLSANTGDYGARENYLLLILVDDSLYGKPGEETPMMKAMLRTLQTEKNPDKFFSLYRHSNYIALKAAQDLASFYNNDSKRLDRALPVAALASCIAVTRLAEAMKQMDFEYEYSSFSDLLIRTGKNAALTQWSKDIHLWDSFSLLASILYEQGYRDQALSIWSEISRNCPDRIQAKIAERSILQNIR